jgi:hypothetical protein
MMIHHENFSAFLFYVACGPRFFFFLSLCYCTQVRRAVFSVLLFRQISETMPAAKALAAQTRIRQVAKRREAEWEKAPKATKTMPPEPGCMARLLHAAPQLRRLTFNVYVSEDSLWVLSETCAPIGRFLAHSLMQMTVHVTGPHSRERQKRGVPRHAFRD